MAELTPAADTTVNSCCAAEEQATCCEPSDKADCCEHDDSCGCDASNSSSHSLERLVETKTASQSSPSPHSERSSRAAALGHEERRG
jgi:hypothetical protein